MPKSTKQTTTKLFKEHWENQLLLAMWPKHWFAPKIPRSFLEYAEATKRKYEEIIK